MESMTSLDQLDDTFQRNLKKVIEVGFSPDLWNNISSFNQAFDKFLTILEESPLQYSVPYNRIAKVVFGLSTTDGIESFKPAFYQLMDKYYQKEDHDDRVYNQLKKTISHIELAIIQKTSLLQTQRDQIKELGDGLTQLNSSYKEMQTKLDRDIKNSEDRFNDRVDTMYNSFISVLGIFIAISFSLFGAATLLKNIFTIATSEGFNVSAKVVGTNISLAGFSTILIYLLVIGLVQGISTVTNKAYFFSLKKLFVVMSVALGVVVIGYFYGHASPSWKHMGLVFAFLSGYIILGLLIYKKIPWTEEKVDTQK